MLRNLIEQLTNRRFGSNRHRQSRRAAFRRRIARGLQFESLENRNLLAGITDNVPSPNLLVNGTTVGNTINYTNGPGGGIFASDNTGLVAIDNFETIEFGNKMNLILNGDAGNDTVTLNAALTPIGLTSVIVRAGDDDDVVNLLAANVQNLTIDGNAGNNTTRIADSGPGVFDSGNITFLNTAVEFEIGGTMPGSGLGFHDLLNVTGTVTIGSNVTLVINAFGDGQGVNFVPADGDQFVLINNNNDDGSEVVMGSFAGLAEGALLSNNFLGSGLNAFLTYRGGTNNNDVVIVVNGAPFISGAVSNQMVNDNATIAPFSRVRISAASPALTVTVSLSGGDANGLLTSLGFFNATGPGTYQLTGADGTGASAAIQALVFDPTDNQVAPGQVVTTTFTITVDDGNEQTASDSLTTVNATSINDAPVLTPTGNQILTGTDEDTISPGDLVSAIVGATINDIDAGAIEGIAITTTTGNGIWQFSTDTGANFSAVGVVSITQALLLRATDLVRYVPDQLNGETATITYRAWDQTGTTAGQQGLKVNVAEPGDTTPFSLNVDTASIVVSNLNDVPMLTAIGNQTVNEQATLTFTAAATDQDLPAQNLTFSLDAAALSAGMTINATRPAHSASRQRSLKAGWCSMLRSRSPTTVRTRRTCLPAKRFQITVNEVNVAPVLTAIGNQTVNEQATLTFRAAATDQDIPAQNLTFSLDAAALSAGMTINATTGAFSFTPTESQGGLVLNATITVTDNGANVANLTASETISITVNEVNVAPVLTAIGNQTVNEQATLTFTVAATDQDLPTQNLTFSLDAAALSAGMTINATTGVFSFTPTESQGGLVFNTTITVTDNGANVANLTASETISITVNEVNVAPVLAAIGNQTVNEQATLTFTVAATDQDLPAQNLTFSLDAAALSAGMTINATTGAFSFTPTESQGGMVFNATITVTDDGANVANLTASETISITVNEVNVVPVLTAIGNQTVNEQSHANFQRSGH